jgi:hypothetical protein
MTATFIFKQKFFRTGFALLVIAFSTISCTATPPKNISNICEIFFEKRDWFDSAEDIADKWGAPIHVTMAMMYQESSFRADAIPPKDYVFFGLIPWGRVSSAYGYSQAKTLTWADYRRETGNDWADREDFDDAIDFMGWFISKTHKLNRVSKWDAEAQYLNYHEGWGGYKRKSFRKKKWLEVVAKRVKARSLRYATQLKSCKEELQEGWFWRMLT